MNESIAFPNLNLYFEHVGRSFHVFGIEITYYGVTLAIGMMLGIAFAFREAKRVGLDPDRFFNMALIAVVAGIIGARVYYVAFRWDYYRDHLMEIFNYRQGGIAVYGSIIGAMIAIVIYTRVKRMSFRLVTDTCCMGLLIGQFIGRWGNFFNREAFGGYTDGLFAMRLPINAVRSGDISADIAAHAANGFIQVHPTFLYESLWNLGLFCLLFFFRKHKRFDGQLFLLYLLGYGIGRFWIEGLRTDQLLMPVTGLPVSQVLSGVLVALALILLVAGHFTRRKIS